MNITVCELICEILWARAFVQWEKNKLQVFSMMQLNQERSLPRKVRLYTLARCGDRTIGLLVTFASWFWESSRMESTRVQASGCSLNWVNTCWATCCYIVEWRCSHLSACVREFVHNNYVRVCNYICCLETTHICAIYIHILYRVQICSCVGMDGASPEVPWCCRSSWRPSPASSCPSCSQSPADASPALHWTEIPTPSFERRELRESTKKEREFLWLFSTMHYTRARHVIAESAKTILGGYIIDQRWPRLLRSQRLLVHV